MDQNHQLLFELADLLEILLDYTPLLTDILPTPDIPKPALNKSCSNTILFPYQTPPYLTPTLDWEYVTAIVQKTPPLACLDWVVYQQTNVDYGYHVAVCKYQLDVQSLPYCLDQTVDNRTDAVYVELLVIDQYPFAVL
jgi:hypothetical protein